MARFLARPLQALDRIYRFVETGGPREVEVAQPVQLVHEVGRMAELGGPSMGFFLAGQDQVHPGVDTQENAFDPYQEVAFLYPNVSDIWVWLIAAWMTQSAVILSTVSGGSLTIGWAPYGEQIPRRDIPVMYWYQSISIFDQNVSPATLPVGGTAGANIVNTLPLPFPIFPGSTCRVRTLSTGAGTIRVEGLFWAGAIGTRPPGW